MSWPLPSRLALLLVLLACGPSEDPRYSSPALTWQTYARAVAGGDAAAAWDCFSSSYQALQYEGDAGRWAAELERRGPELKRDYQRREIAEERILGKRLAYLLFDSSTVSGAGASPFVYFLREVDGWKMTTHLDAVFHRELEGAIERGEFRLPERD